MGITIHFEGRLKDIQSYERCISTLMVFIEKNSWDYIKIPEKVRSLSRSNDEEDWNYTGKTKGIEIRPHSNIEPFRFEIDEDLHIQEYCKTQFGPIEIHIELINLLKALEPEFAELDIFDEGEYYDSGNVERLNELIQGCHNLMDEMREKDPNLEGPITLPSGRIVDLMS